jgi:L,D-transpeptidase catalytic domain
MPLRGDETTRLRQGLLGSWGLFVIALVLLGSVSTGVWANWLDEKRLRRLDGIDDRVARRLGPKLEKLRETARQRELRLSGLRSRVEKVEVSLDDSGDTDRTILVSTAENRVFVREAGKIIFQAICSTGKGNTLQADGKTMTFDTPTGRFRILSKEENPVWVPPDWHFIEEARKRNLKLVRLEPGEAIDAETGKVVPARRSRGILSWLGLRRRPDRLLKVQDDTVVEVAADGAGRALPPGKTIRAGDAIVVPPVTASQRRFEKVLGRYRLNLGEGYALHGTLATDQLGRSVSHGCIRLGDTDMETLYGMAAVGDQVIIY